MPVGKMHDDERAVDADLVRDLLRAQHPVWSDQPIEPVARSGTDNALFRVGAHLVARVPRTERAAHRLTIEQELLPRLAPSLPVRIPELVAGGEASALHPWPWCLLRWIDGVDGWDAPAIDAQALAEHLAGLVATLRALTPEDAPTGHRSDPLGLADPMVRDALGALPADLDRSAVAVAWEQAVSLPVWSGPPCWTHGDLQPTNLLVRDGALAAVLDFGCAGLGDPAADLIPAWSVLSGSGRRTFRSLTEPDEETWGRGRGWALAMGVNALTYYRRSNPRFAAMARRTVERVLDVPA
jgi:aminoglycoside phosphotransferase (APT) family kinase protein